MRVPVRFYGPISLPPTLNIGEITGLRGSITAFAMATVAMISGVSTAIVDFDKLLIYDRILTQTGSPIVAAAFLKLGTCINKDSKGRPINDSPISCHNIGATRPERDTGAGDDEPQP